MARIDVWAEKLPADIRQDGLVGRHLTQQATEYLQRAGVQAQGLLASPGPNAQPYLAIEVTALKIPEINRYVYGLALHLKQRVVLGRNPAQSTAGSTWHVNSVGLTHIENMPQKIEVALGQLLDQFIDTYAKANQLPSSAPPQAVPTPVPVPAAGF